jgi:hypothetical protein
MKINPIGHLVKANPIQTQSNPISEKPKMNVNLYVIEDYRKKDDFAVQKNKPNSNPISEKPKMNANVFITKDYENETTLRPQKNKPNQSQFLHHWLRLDFSISICNFALLFLMFDIPSTLAAKSVKRACRLLQFKEDSDIIAESKGVRAFLKVLFFKAPHLCGHLFGSHPPDMPVEKQTIAAVFMPGPCHPSASSYGLNVRTGQMFPLEDITSSNISVGRHFDYGPPPPVLVVGKVDGSGGALTVGQLGRHALHTPAIVTFTTPAVDDIANGLFFVRIARTAKYLHVTVIIVDILLCQKRHKKLEPGLYSSSPFRRTWDVQTVIIRIKVRRQADLTQIISANNIPALFPGLSKYRKQYRHQQRNNGNHHQQFYQRKPRPVRELSSPKGVLRTNGACLKSSVFPNRNLNF